MNCDFIKFYRSCKQKMKHYVAYFFENNFIRLFSYSPYILECNTEF